MVTITNDKGISLSAHAGENGAPLRVRVSKPFRDSGDFAETETARDRRRTRRQVCAGKRAYLMGA